jgi:hypothetical protein
MKKDNPFFAYPCGVEWDPSDVYRPHAPDPNRRRVTFKLDKGEAFLPLDPEDYSWMRNYVSLLQQINRGTYVLVKKDEKLGADVIVNMWTTDQGTARMKALDGGGLAIRLSGSAARYELTPATPQFESLRERLLVLDGLPLILALSDDGEILNGSPEVLGLDVPRRRNVIPSCGIDPAKLPWIDPSRVQGLFDSLAPATCPLPEAKEDCVPYLFPDNGCWVRAHLICIHLREKHKVEAGKVWVFGNLETATPHHKTGRVKWEMHVAPVVRVGNGPGDLRVLDPSVFCGPASVASWERAVVKFKTGLNYTYAKIYSQFDPCDMAEEENGELQRNLKYFHACLVSRGKGKKIPPPYFSELCPNKP